MSKSAIKNPNPIWESHVYHIGHMGFPNRAFDGRSGLIDWRVAENTEVAGVSVFLGLLS